MRRHIAMSTCQIPETCSSQRSQLLPVFIEVYAEGLVAAHKAAQLRPAAAAAGGGGEEDGGEEEVDLDAFVEAPEIDMDDL